MSRRFEVEASHVLPNRWHVRDNATGLIVRKPRGSRPAVAVFRTFEAAEHFAGVRERAESRSSKAGAP